MPTVLSVQSRVAYGHVGNAASVFPLQRLGIEAWALDTVAFSNHTGHGQWLGAARPVNVVPGSVKIGAWVHTGSFATRSISPRNSR